MRRYQVAANPARTQGLEFRPQLPPNSITGPIHAYYYRASVPTRTAGISLHTLVDASGQSAWDMAATLAATPDATLVFTLREARRLQIAAGLSPIVVVWINTAVNDRNETFTPSRGPGAVFGAGDSTAEYVDNIRAIQTRIRRLWQANGWPTGELHWLIVPSHRISDPDDAELVAYRAAAQATLGTEPQTSVVDVGALMTAAEATAGGWYDGGGAVHMTATGYAAVSTRIVALVP